MTTLNTRIKKITKNKTRPAKNIYAIRARWDKQVSYALKYGKSYKNFKELFEDLK